MAIRQRGGSSTIMNSEVKPKTILAGDIGGTKTRLALYRTVRGNLKLLVENVFQSKGYAGLEAILHDFLPKQVPIGAACFGIAGPVEGGVIRTTNLPWSVDTESLQKEFDAREIFLINDLVATAYGIKVLRKSDFQVLNKGIERAGNRAILSAGQASGRLSFFGMERSMFRLPLKGVTWILDQELPVKLAFFNTSMIALAT